MQENKKIDVVTSLARTYDVLEEVGREGGQKAVAMALAKAGVRVFPASAGVGVHGSGPEDVNNKIEAKSPLVGCGFSHGFKDATTDLRKLERAWRQWPTAMVGVPADANGIIVVDIDRPKLNSKTGEMSADGMDVFREWEAEHGPFTTKRARTASGGYHLYFRKPSGKPLPQYSHIFNGSIDTRTTGYVIAPGSRDSEGRGYVLETPGADIEPLPAWLEALLRNPPRPRKETRAAPSAPLTTLTERKIVGASSGGARNRRGPDGWTGYGRKAVEGAVSDVAGTEKGARHSTIFARARHLGEVMAKGHIPPSACESLRQELISAGLSTGQDARDVVAAVRDGLMAGLANPNATDVPDVEEAPLPGTDCRRAASGMGQKGGKKATAGAGEGGADSSSCTSSARWVSFGDDSAASFTSSFRRGLTPETCRAYGLACQLGFNRDGVPTPWMKIPTGEESWIEVDATPEDAVSRGYQRERKRRTGDSGVFRLDALLSADRPVFVVMDELDALSIVDAGGEAIALGDAGNVGKVLEKLKAGPTAYPLILALNDGADAVNARGVLAGEMAKRRMEAVLFDPGEGHASVNAFLATDRPGLEALLASIVDGDSARAVVREREEARLDALSTSADLDGYLDRIEARSGGECVPTGFSTLDKLLDGGLYPGLYVVGAVSGLGKTTFCLQVADHIASTGRDVLIFSLEMSKDEMIAKSLSRLTYRASNCTSRFKTTRQILNSRFWEDDEDRAALKRAIADYREEFGGHVFIVEGIGDVGVAQVRTLVERFHSTRGVPPVVLVDYLQILAPVDVRATDKQNTDKNILELKRISRDVSTTVIGVSSFNRENYQASVNLTAFKESGAIEYSSDVVLGIQYDGMEGVEGESDTTRKTRTQKVLAEVDERSRTGADQTVQVKILKNRNGRRGDVLFTLCNAYNTFTELPLKVQEARWNRARAAAHGKDAGGGGTYVEVTGSFGKRREKGKASV